MDASKLNSGPDGSELCLYFVSNLAVPCCSFSSIEKKFAFVNGHLPENSE